MPITGRIIPPRYVNGGLQQSHDSVPGGAGHVRRIADHLEEVVEAAIARVKSCESCQPDTACYGCLKTYDNQFCHHLLSRGAVLEFLTGAGYWARCRTSKPALDPRAFAGGSSTKSEPRSGADFACYRLLLVVLCISVRPPNYPQRHSHQAQDLAVAGRRRSRTEEVTMEDPAKVLRGKG